MLVRRDLACEGRGYLRSYLEANAAFGKQLGRLLIEHHDVNAGDLWAYVPAPLPSSRRVPLTDFEVGGLDPGRDPQRAEKLRHGLGVLAEAGATYAFTEHALARPSDGFLKTYEGPVLFCGESVFFFSLLEGSTLTPQLRMGGATWMPEITIIAGGSATVPDDRLSVARDYLVTATENVRAVIIGAWDDEGMIFWEPAPRS